MRLYVDPRQIETADSTGTATFTLISASENRSGSHDMTGNSADYLYDMPETFTVRALFRPEFAYNVGADQTIWSWKLAATKGLRLYYQASSDKFLLSWQDGGTERTMESQMFDDGTHQEDIDQDLTIDCVIDLSSGGVTSGSALYVNRVVRDSTWSGAIDAKAENFFWLSLRSDQGSTVGNVSLNHVRIFPGLLATADQVANDFKDVRHEETYWPLDGHATGFSRCNVSHRFLSFAMERSQIDVLGRRTANVAEVLLNNHDGAFSDDQYGAFEPENNVYNGTSAEKFLQNRCPVWIEHWFGNKYETVFRGRADDTKFARQSGAKTLPTVKLQCFDPVNDIERYVVGAGTKFEDFVMCNPAAESTSLVHTLARLATQRSVANLLANSSFENATIGNSWADDANVTLARVAGGFSDYVAQASTTAGGEGFHQTVTFTGTRKLNVRERYTFKIQLWSASAFSGSIKVEERDASGVNATSSESFTLSAGEEYAWFEVAHTVTDGDSDRLRCVVALTTTGVNVFADRASLTYGASARLVVNANDGAGGVESADDAVSGTYDLVGFDVDQVVITHPWVTLEKFTSPWRKLRELAAATLGQYLGCDAAGTIKYRSRMKAGYSDPSSLETFTDKMMSVASVLEERGANSIVIRGVDIVKQDSVRKVWDAADTGSFDTKGDLLHEAVAAGASWPNESDYPSYWAKYDDEIGE